MKILPYIRLVTYAMIVAIAFMHGRVSHFLPVSFAQQEDAPGPAPFVEEGMWRGKDDAWIKKQLGDAMWEHAIEQPVPDIGVFQGVQARLEKEYPQYTGAIRSQIWKKGPRSFQVFCVRPAGSWVVLDSVSWQEGVEF